MPAPGRDQVIRRHRRLLARCLAPLADRYRAYWATGGPGAKEFARSGPLPGGEAAVPILDALFAAALPKPPHLVLSLFRGQAELAVLPADTAERLYLTPKELTQLQAALEAQGLPPDLFLPSREHPWWIFWRDLGLPG